MKLLPLLSAAIACLTVATAATNYTGDTVNGLPVISSLDVSDLTLSKVHRFYLRAGELNSGMPVHVPVWVARGSQANGTNFWMSTVVHGEELNGVRVLHYVLKDLEDAVASNRLNGTVIGVPGANTMGMYTNSRSIYESSGSGSFVNLNRVFPGISANESGSTFTNNLAYKIFFDLAKNGTQVDVAVDLHTQSTGSDVPQWGYSDYRNAGARKLSDLAAVDVLKIDEGEPGSLETTFVQQGVPAITLEISAAKLWQKQYIRRAYLFLLRALDEFNVLSQPRDSEAWTEYQPNRTYAANTFYGDSARQGGFFEPTVKVLDDVTAGQVVGNMYNAFGDVLDTYTAKYPGRVLSVATDPVREIGASLVRMVYNSTDSA